MRELLEILEAMVSKKAQVEDSLELFLDIAERIAKSASAVFEVKSDEVAILMLTSDLRHLRFAAPRSFVELGTIPLTKRDSIAVGVLGKGVGNVQNNVPVVKHVAFFESVRIRSRPVPIQKMITVPLLYRNGVAGVAQISRKGETSEDAGPDSSAGDVKKAEGFFQEASPYLWRARPDSF